MLPHLILHAMMSLDGRLDWGSWDLGLYYGLASSWEIDAVLCGSNTLLAADIPEDASDEWAAGPGQEPAKQRLVVVDSRGRLRNWAQLKRQPFWRDPIALCSAATDPGYLQHLDEQGIEYIQRGDEQVDLRAALMELKSGYGLDMIRVDSGGILNGVLLRAGLVSEVSVLIGAELVGGTSPRSIFVAPDLSSPQGIVKLRLTSLEKMRDDYVWLRYEVSQ